MAKKFLVSAKAPKAGNLQYYYLPKGRFPLKIMYDGVGNFIMEAGEVELIPDPAHQYFLRYQGGISTNDDILVTVSENGFLQQVTTKIEDQTGAILDKLVELGTTVAQVATGGIFKTKSMEPGIVFDGVLDPFDEIQMAQINAALEPLNASISATMMEHGKGVVAEEVSEQSGFYIRPMGTCEVKIEGGDYACILRINIPNAEATQFMEIPYAPFVKTEFDVTFNSFGYPLKVNIKKPSSLLAFMDAPIKALKAVLTIPSQIFQFRVNMDNSRLAKLEHDLAYQQQYSELSQKVAENQPATEAKTSTRGLAQTGPASGNVEVEPGLDARLKALEEGLTVVRRKQNDETT
ncbi:MAG: hypothetical protein AAFV07_10835 [Bacteroidota bacterium]